MKIGAIIQARSGSTRLPNKHFLKVNNQPIIVELINRLKKIKTISDIIIATTKKKQDNKFINLSKKNKIKIFRGKEMDCLNRVHNAALKNNLDVIVFITGDCPIFDYKILKKLIKFFLKNKFEYIGNSFVRSFPDGMDIQIFSIKTIKKLEKMVSSKIEREHVTLGIKKNPKKFKIYNLIADKKNYWPSLALTLDTKQDFILIKKVLNYFNKKKKPFFSCQDVIRLLKTKKKWLSINKHILRESNEL
jgi:spore coat polysaccharide biosynthesis protein SpsF (cytidylyltransferase family)